MLEEINTLMAFFMFDELLPKKTDGMGKKKLKSRENFKKNRVFVVISEFII